VPAPKRATNSRSARPAAKAQPSADSAESAANSTSPWSIRGAFISHSRQGNIRKIAAKDTVPKRSNTPSTAISSIVSIGHSLSSCPLAVLKLGCKVRQESVSLHQPQSPAHGGHFLCGTGASPLVEQIPAHTIVPYSKFVLGALLGPKGGDGGTTRGKQSDRRSIEWAEDIGR
jgi:hypothetical protein